jgi:hypothetical protein
MTPFDRLAWRCSWVAPFAGCAGVLTLLISIAVARRRPESDLYDALVILTFASWGIGLLSHFVVHYHALKAGSLGLMGLGERARLDVALRFGGGYAWWRAHMRRVHPELRQVQAVRHDQR